MNHPTPNHLIARNAHLLVATLEKKGSVEARRDARGFYPFSHYRLAAIAETLRSVLQEPEIELTVIARKKFGDDLCLKLPRLLKEQGSAGYMQKTIPQITELLAHDERTRELFAGVTVKGIYINLRLSTERIASFLSEIIDGGARYGEGDLWRGNGIVVDYSSPNLAKKLHAGHIRSTIIGHILSNLYEAVGAYVYRTNHVNDLGGVGYLIAGYRRWQELLPVDATKGQQLAALYLIFRSLQKVYDGGASEQLFASERDQIIACFPEIISPEQQIVAADFLEAFAGFKEEATAIQEKLERGDPETVSIWLAFVSWSLEEFQRFYDLLGVSIDFVLGESFYLPGALSLIQQAVAEGSAVVWTSEHSEAVERRFAEQLAREEIAQPLYETLVKEAKQDIGATVVPLSDRERVVILRADGVSIYTSRDLEAIRFRAATFSPKRIVYEVGVEQNDHFTNLFAAARRLHLCDESVELVHVAHENYVDATTKKKLSSRHGSSGVEELLSSTIRYFRDKYGSDAGFSERETDTIAHQLGVGSIIFNDIKKDKRFPVEVQEDLRKMHEEFERSGGAYVVYTACRARSIIRKWGKPLPLIGECPGVSELDPVEIELIKELIQYPQKVAEAARADSPALLTQYLLELSRTYNSYYASFPVIKGEVVHEHRLVITKAAQTVLENGLNVCAIECPERI